MSGNIKINPDLAAQVASVFAQKSADLTMITQSLNGQVDSQIGSGKPAWEGQQATEFEDAWRNEFKPALERLVNALDGSRDLLTKTIAAYRQLDS